MNKQTPYHHGALREALLDAAETILRTRGPAALTLRAIAREVGVSHGSPAHHFGDLAGLLSELAAVGFRRLAAQLQTAIDDNPDRPRWAGDHAYVAFALQNRELFSLMFGQGRVDRTRPALLEAGRAAFAILAEVTPTGSHAEAPPMKRVGRMTAAWCMLHGFAVLAIDDRLRPLFGAAPEGTSIAELLEAALHEMTFRDDPFPSVVGR
jgi:AcrR family transcriptional regulator